MTDSDLKIPAPGGEGKLSANSGYVVRLPQPGDWVAERFQITRPLGSGGFGTVYEAWQESMGHRRVALKILAPRNAHEPHAIERFRQEALFASRLSHPNTITLFDFGATDTGLFYIAMEYLDGEPLSEVLRRSGPMSVERAENITRQVLQSLAEAHSIGLIHRDLKPDNIFLCRIFGEQDFVKVLDFGLAKIAGVFEDDRPTLGEFPAEARADLTLEGLVCGTPEFMAPEQARGEENVSAAADVYAVGLLIYTMLTASKPFSAQDPVAILEAQIAEPLPMVPEGARSHRLTRVMEIAARKARDERYADAQAMLYSLTGRLPLDPMREPDQEELQPAPTTDPATDNRHQARRSSDYGTVASPVGDFVVEVNIEGESIEPAAELPPDSPTGSTMDSVDIPTGSFHASEVPATGSVPVPPNTGQAHQPLPLAPAWISGAIPLIGREAEVGQLLEVVRAAMEQQKSRFLIVEGDAGVGKSRLLSEIIRIMQQTSDLIVASGFFRDPLADSLAALRRLVSHLFGLDLNFARQLHAAGRLRQFLTESLDNLGVKISYLEADGVARLLGLDPLGGMSDAQSALDRLSRLFVSIARQQPMMIVLEDVQFADPTSMDLILEVARSVYKTRYGGRSNLIVVLSYRRHGDRAELTRLMTGLREIAEDELYSMTLEGLSDEACERLVDALMPVHPDLRRRVASVAHGNPLHAIQTMRHLAEDDRLHHDEGVWQLIPSSQGQVSLPRDLTEMIRLRVGHFIATSSAPEAMQELLYRLAVLGRRTPEQLLRTAVSLEERPWPDSLFDRLLGELFDGGIVTSSVQLPAEDDDDDRTLGPVHKRLTFEHGLLHEILMREAENTLAGPRMHRTAAEAKLTFYQVRPPGFAAALAEHWVKAHDPERALPWMIEAAAHLQSIGDLHGALARYRDADSVLSAIAGMDATTRRYARKVRLAMGQIHLRFGEYGPALGHLRRLIAHTDEDNAAATELAAAHCCLGEIHYQQQNPPLARIHLQKAVKLAQDCGDAEPEIRARILLGEVDLAELGHVPGHYITDFEERLEQLEEATPQIRARGLQHLGRIVLATDDAGRAEGYLGRAHMLAEAGGDPSTRAPIASDLGYALLRQRRTAEGEGRLREALADYRELGDKVGLAVCQRRLGLAAWQRGDAAEALETLHTALQIQRAASVVAHQAETLALIGRVHEAEGRLQEAISAYEHAMENHPVHGRAELVMRLGSAMLKSGDVARSREILDRACQELAQRVHSSDYVEALNLLAMASSWANDDEEAKNALSRSRVAAAAIDHQGGLTFALAAGALIAWRQADLEQCRAYLDEARTTAQQDPSRQQAPLVDVVDSLAAGHPPERASADLPALQRAWVAHLARTRVPV